MTASIPPLAWRPALPAVIAAVALACAASAGAADPSAPTPGPLWKAYPLDTGKSASTTPVQAQPTSTTPTSSARLDPRRQVAPLGILILFYAALGGVALCVVGLAGRHVRRRRSVRRSRSVPPPTGALRG